MREWTRLVPFGKGEILILWAGAPARRESSLQPRKGLIDIEQMLVAVDDLDLEEIRRWLAHLMDDDSRVIEFETAVAEFRGA